MFVEIKRSRLFVGFFSEVVARSKTNACPYQAQDFLLVVFQKLLLGQELMFVQIKGLRLFVGFFSRSCC
jgi:hypothetical protein